MKKIMFDDRYGLTEAVLQGRKTQTRRLIKFHPLDAQYAYKENFPIGGYVASEIIDHYSRYKIGEVLAIAQAYKDIACGALYDDLKEIVRNRKPETLAGWTNKMFVRADLMPHHIRITDVDVERLQDISDEDCIQEGIHKDNCKTYFNGYAFETCKDQYGDVLAAQWYRTPREAYAALIDRISGKGAWDMNHYVFVYDFELVD